LVSRRSFSREFKLELCRKVESGELSKSRACREHGLSGSLLSRWLEHYRAKGEEAFDGGEWRPSVMSPESRVRELEAALGRAHLEIELLQAALSKKGARERSSGR
jgi:transposase-like protein